MDIVGLLITLAIGAAAGWLAGLLVEGAGFGLLWNILIGIAGAFVAAWLFPRLGLGLTLGGGIVGVMRGDLGSGGPASGGQSDTTARQLSSGYFRAGLSLRSHQVMKRAEVLPPKAGTCRPFSTTRPKCCR